MPTIALLPGDHTGGSVDLVDIKAGTPGSSRPSVTNHLALMKNTAQGVEEVGKSLRLHDLEQAEGHVAPEEDGTRYDLETRFSPVDEQRELLVRQRDDGDTTKVWSNTWPDEADISAFKPKSIASIDGTSVEIENPSVRVGGGGGELEYTCTYRLDEKYCGPAWVANIQLPSNALFWEYEVVIPDGGESETILGAVQPEVLDVQKDAISGLYDTALETKDALLSTVDSAVRSKPHQDMTLESEMDIRRTELGDCRFQFDLDGVMAWNNQSVSHGKCNGAFTVNHTSDDYGLELEGGQTDDSGELDDVSIQFKNDTYRKGNTTYREATLDGFHDYDNPYLTYRDYDREYELSECFWETNCS